MFREMTHGRNHYMANSGWVQHRVLMGTSSAIDVESLLELMQGHVQHTLGLVQRKRTGLWRQKLLASSNIPHFEGPCDRAETLSEHIPQIVMAMHHKQTVA
jgi:hypothetical protein